MRAASNSSVFRDILAPFSAKLAQRNASPSRAAVSGCQALSNVPTLSGSKSAAAAATPPTAAVPPVRAPPVIFCMPWAECLPHPQLVDILAVSVIPHQRCTPHV